MKFNTEPFKETIDNFTKGEIDAKAYKGISGGYGTYAQRGGKSHMIRLRFAGGEINKEQIRFVAETMKKYNIDLAHITTCQTIQLHNLNPETVCEVMDSAQEVGIYTKGGGGDHPRNVMASPLSGVDRDEYFDVMPYAKAASEYLLELDDNIKMPRKLKVAFSSSEKNETHATFRDLGFVARKDGKFDVYSAGGLGNAPKLGLLTAECIDPAEALIYIRAMVLNFLEHGNYQNRAKARTRFMRDALGDEKYLQEFNKNLEIARAENIKKITAEKEETENCACNEYGNDRVICQKQKGLYAVKWMPVGGNIDADMMGRLADAVCESENALIRLLPGSGMYIINCTADEAARFLEITDGLAAKTPIERSTACIGNSICQIGLQDSQKLLKEIIDAVKNAGVSPDSLPSVHISGCTSSCSAHQTNVIGFQGRMKKNEEDQKVYPAFTMFINGEDKQGTEKLGDACGIIFAHEIPALLVEIAKAVDDKNMDFMSWYKTYPDEIKSIVEKYN